MNMRGGSLDNYPSGVLPTSPPLVPTAEDIPAANRCVGWPWIVQQPSGNFVRMMRKYNRPPIWHTRAVSRQIPLPSDCWFSPVTCTHRPPSSSGRSPAKGSEKAPPSPLTSTCLDQSEKTTRNAGMRKVRRGEGEAAASTPKVDARMPERRHPKI